MVNSELCAGDTWRFLNGLQDLGPGHCQPLLCDLLPWVLEALTSPFFPKRSPLPYGRDFSWPETWVEPGGKQPSVPAGAPPRQLLSCPHPRPEAAPICCQVFLGPHRSDWLSPSWGDRWRLYVLGSPPPLRHPAGL